MRNIFLTILTLPTLIVVALWSSFTVHPMIATLSEVDISNPVVRLLPPFAIAVAILIYFAIGIVYRKKSSLNGRYFVSHESRSLGSATLIFFLDVLARFLMIPLLLAILISSIILTVHLFQNAETPIPNLISPEAAPEVVTLRQTLLFTGAIVLASRGFLGFLKKRLNSKRLNSERLNSERGEAPQSCEKEPAK